MWFIAVLPNFNIQNHSSFIRNATKHSRDLKLKKKVEAIKSRKENRRKAVKKEKSSFCGGGANDDDVFSSWAPHHVRKVWAGRVCWVKSFMFVFFFSSFHLFLSVAGSYWRQRGERWTGKCLSSLTDLCVVIFVNREVDTRNIRIYYIKNTFQHLERDERRMGARFFTTPSFSKMFLIKWTSEIWR